MLSLGQNCIIAKDVKKLTAAMSDVRCDIKVEVLSWPKTVATHAQLGLSHKGRVTN